MEETIVKPAEMPEENETSTEEAEATLEVETSEE